MVLTEYLREMHRISARRDGAIYRTTYLRDVWVTKMDIAFPPEDHFYVVKPTTFPGETFRLRKVPDASPKDGDADA